MAINYELHFPFGRHRFDQCFKRHEPEHTGGHDSQVSIADLLCDGFKQDLVGFLPHRTGQYSPSQKLLIV